MREVFNADECDFQRETPTARCQQQYLRAQILLRAQPNLAASPYGGTGGCVQRTGQGSRRGLGRGRRRRRDEAVCTRAFRSHRFSPPIEPARAQSAPDEVVEELPAPDAYVEQPSSKDCGFYLGSFCSRAISTDAIVQGFATPTKTDRRFFRTRLRELEDQGFVERVQVAHANQKRFPDKKVMCVRLVSDETASQVDGTPIDESDLQRESLAARICFACLKMCVWK